jgi:hypothetical protein
MLFAFPPESMFAFTGIPSKRCFANLPGPEQSDGGELT